MLYYNINSEESEQIPSITYVLFDWILSKLMSGLFASSLNASVPAIRTLLFRLSMMIGMFNLSERGIF